MSFAETAVTPAPPVRSSSHDMPRVGAGGGLKGQNWRQGKGLGPLFEKLTRPQSLRRVIMYVLRGVRERVLRPDPRT